ncbi:MAG TPA: hypothetical protein VF070_41100 [Streptosporangiaceae bacterium]
MTTSIVFAVVAVLAVGQFLLFGALAEAYRDIRQIREQEGLIDRAAPVDLGQAQNQVPSRIGLPPELDSAARAVVVYVDKRCGTCRMIVGSLNGGIPRGVWLTVISETEHEASEWLDHTAGIRLDSEPGRRVIVTSTDEVERHLGQVLTPLAIEIENGRLVRAKAVPSMRQFYSLVPTLITLSTPITQEVAQS